MSWSQVATPTSGSLDQLDVSNPPGGRAGPPRCRPKGNGVIRARSVNRSRNFIQARTAPCATSRHAGRFERISASGPNHRLPYRFSDRGRHRPDRPAPSHGEAGRLPPHLRHDDPRGVRRADRRTGSSACQGIDDGDAAPAHTSPSSRATRRDRRVRAGLRQQPLRGTCAEDDQAASAEAGRGRGSEDEGRVIGRRWRGSADARGTRFCQPAVR